MATILKLKYNSTQFGSFDLAKSGIATAMETANTGELWAGVYGEGAVLGFKGANGAVIFCDAAHMTAAMETALSSYATTEAVETLLTNYYTKTDIDDTVTELKGLIEEVQTAAISVKAGNGISVTGEGTEKTIAQNIVLKIDNVGGTEKIQILDKTTTTVIAEVDASKFVVDGMLKDATYDSATHKLKLTWNLGTGDDKTLEVDLQDLVDVYTAGDGLVLEDNKFSVKVDTTSEGAETFLTVGANGVKLSGVQSAIDTAKEAATTEAVNTVKGYTVNGQAFDTTGWAVKAEHIGMNTIEGVTADNVQTALESLKEAVDGGVTSVTSEDPIKVDSSDVNSPKVSFTYNSNDFVISDGALALNIIDCGTY